MFYLGFWNVLGQLLTRTSMSTHFYDFPQVFVEATGKKTSRFEVLMSWMKKYQNLNNLTPGVH